MWQAPGWEGWTWTTWSFVAGVTTTTLPSVSPNLSNSLGFGGHQSPQKGADTPVWLATGAAGTDTTDCYFEKRRGVTCGSSKDHNTVERPFKACEAYD
jgi:hypothetical protein